MVEEACERQEQHMSASQEQLDIPSQTPANVLADYLRRSISISELIDRIWSGRLIIVLATVAFVAFGAWYVYDLGPRYTATIWVTPAESDTSNGGASGLLAQFSDSGMTAVPKFTQFVSAIPSRGVAKLLDQKYGMVCQLYHGSCDPVTHRWTEQTGIRAFFLGLLADIGRLPDPNGARSINDLADYIQGSVVIDQNKKNAIVVLSYSDRKPEFAAQFLLAVVSTTNDYIKALNRENERRYVAYLANNVSKTTNIDQRQTLNALLLQHERQLMMTEVDVPYAATVLEGPSVTPVNKVLKYLVAFGMLGFALGVIIAFFRDRLAIWRRA
jgi:uncharacterized protein involved in exopolysaccharide biosynthesis